MEQKLKDRSQKNDNRIGKGKEKPVIEPKELSCPFYKKKNDWGEGQQKSFFVLNGN